MMAAFAPDAPLNGSGFSSYNASAVEQAHAQHLDKQQEQLDQKRVAAYSSKYNLDLNVDLTGLHLSDEDVQAAGVEQRDDTQPEHKYTGWLGEYGPEHTWALKAAARSTGQEGPAWKEVDASDESWSLDNLPTGDLDTQPVEQEEEEASSSDSESEGSSATNLTALVGKAQTEEEDLLDLSSTSSASEI
jgi:hypothetical protein